MRALASGVVPSASAKQIGTPICDGSPYLFSLSVRLLGYFHDRIPQQPHTQRIGERWVRRRERARTRRVSRQADWLAAFGINLVEVGSRILDVHPELPADVGPLGIAERRDIDAAHEGTNRAAQTVC